MNSEQLEKGRKFKELHSRDDIFVMPNAWNAGSARMLQAAGFPAIGTTSGGIAFSLGLPDGVPDSPEVLSRDDALDETRRIAAAVRVPVSVDSENGYGDDPEIVAETIRLCAQAGAVGASVEDFSKSAAQPIYDRDFAVERVQAAVAAAAALDMPFTLTARTDCFLYKHPDALRESLARIMRFREVGADCLYVPGVTDPETIRTLVQATDGPLNVVVGFVGEPLTVPQLQDLGVRRISIGAALARATFGLIKRAADEITKNGTFGFTNQQIPHFELAKYLTNQA